MSHLTTAIYTAQQASLERGDPFLAGTNLPTAQYAYWVIDGITVRDESGKEQAILRDQTKAQG